MENKIQYSLLREYIKLKTKYFNKNSLNSNAEDDRKMKEIVNSIEILRILKKQNQIDTDIITEFKKQLPNMIYTLDKYQTKSN